MSNIFTEFVRFYAVAGRRIDGAEAEWIASVISDDEGDPWRARTGSYRVPIHFWVAVDGSHVDIQYGSGKGIGLTDFIDDHYTTERYRPSEPPDQPLPHPQRTPGILGRPGR